MTSSAAIAALLLFVPAASGAVASLRRKPVRKKAAMGAARETEEKMNLYSMWELKRLTRAELRALLDRVMLVIDEEPEGSFHHEIALTNFRNIRWLLANYSAVADTSAPR